MAINKQQARELINVISGVFDNFSGIWSESQRQWLRNIVLGPAIAEIEKLIAESRPPTLYILGRSGHGKSSLINTLAKQKVADVDDIKPCTPSAQPYFISFSDVFSEWRVIDSRGIFETTSPDGAPTINALDQVKHDINHYRPDILLHVIAASETRTLQPDFVAFSEIQQTIKNETGTTTPSLMVLTKIDVLGNPREWPAETSPKKAALIQELLDYVSHKVLKAKSSRIDMNATIKGYQFEQHKDYIGIIPICALHDDSWNIDTLSSFIGTHLPESTLLDYYQGLKRKDLLRLFSTSIIQKFVGIAVLIGIAPIPIVDLMVLVPLQLLLITVIAGLSCRSFSTDSVAEFTVATGINIGTTLGAKQLAQQVIEFIPVIGLPLHGLLAGATTYAIGKAAEAYFFNGEIIKDTSALNFVREWIVRRLMGWGR